MSANYKKNLLFKKLLVIPVIKKKFGQWIQQGLDGSLVNTTKQSLETWQMIEELLTGKHLSVSQLNKVVKKLIDAEEDALEPINALYLAKTGKLKAKANYVRLRKQRKWDDEKIKQELRKTNWKQFFDLASSKNEVIEISDDDAPPLPVSDDESSEDYPGKEPRAKRPRRSPKKARADSSPELIEEPPLEAVLRSKKIYVPDDPMDPRYQRRATGAPNMIDWPDTTPNTWGQAPKNSGFLRYWKRTIFPETGKAIVVAECAPTDVIYQLYQLELYPAFKRYPIFWFDLPPHPIAAYVNDPQPRGFRANASGYYIPHCMRGNPDAYMPIDLANYPPAIVEQTLSRLRAPGERTRLAQETIGGINAGIGVQAATNIPANELVTFASGEIVLVKERPDSKYLITLDFAFGELAIDGTHSLGNSFHGSKINDKSLYGAVPSPSNNAELVFHVAESLIQLPMRKYSDPARLQGLHEYTTAEYIEDMRRLAGTTKNYNSDVYNSITPNKALHKPPYARFFTEHVVMVVATRDIKEKEFISIDYGKNYPPSQRNFPRIDDDEEEKKEDEDDEVQEVPRAQSPPPEDEEEVVIHKKRKQRGKGPQPHHERSKPLHHVLYTKEEHEIPAWPGYFINKVGLIMNNKMEPVIPVLSKKTKRVEVLLKNANSNIAGHVDLAWLVATTFLPNLENGKDVFHLDGNVLNNDVSNLAWRPCAEDLSDEDND
jgi:hypothetical protein